MIATSGRAGWLARLLVALLIASLLVTGPARAQDDDDGEDDDDLPNLLPTPTVVVPTLPAPTVAVPVPTLSIPAPTAIVPTSTPVVVIPTAVSPPPTAIVSIPTAIGPIATSVSDKADDKATKAADKATKVADKAEDKATEAAEDDGGGNSGEGGDGDGGNSGEGNSGGEDDGLSVGETRDGAGDRVEEELPVVDVEISEEDAASGTVYRRQSPDGTPAALISVIDVDPRKGRDGYLAGELVVQLEAGAAIEALNARFGTSTVKEIGPDPFYLLRVPADLDLEETAEAVRDDPEVAWVDLNFVGQAPEGRPGYFFVSSRPGVPATETDLRTQLEEIGGATCVAGRGIIVAVLDTGVDMTHPDLVGRITGTPYNVLSGTSNVADVGNEVDDDGDGRIDEMTGHGTHVAGIIAQVAPDAAILPIRVLNSDGVGDAFFLAEAIIYAVDQGADVINLSLGSSRDARVVREAAGYAHERGVLVVAAAGNNNREVSEYPAAYDTVVSVNAIDDEERRAGFSNYGVTVDVAAPGVEVLSAATGGGYVRWSGTSMSVPFVSATAALVASTDGDWEPARLARRVVDSAVALPDGRRGERDMSRVEAMRATRCDRLPQP